MSVNECLVVIGSAAMLLSVHPRAAVATELVYHYQCVYVDPIKVLWVSVNVMYTSNPFLFFMQGVISPIFVG